MTQATQDTLAPQVTLFHLPNTRSTGALILLQELQAGYVLHVLNMKAGEQRGAAYLAINPMGKVPAVMHGSALVTEQVAVFLYLAGGAALTWTTAFKLVPELPVIRAYMDRVNARPSVAWARAKDPELAAGQGA